MAEPGRVEGHPAERSCAENAVTVCRLVAEDWQAYRAIRLAMLQESPWAFGSTYAQAAGHDEQAWRQRLTDNAVFLATVEGPPAGSVMYSDSWAGDPADGYLVGMWVDPGFRGRGAGTPLVAAAAGEARQRGKQRLLLDVVQSNQPALGLYQRCGFVATGRTTPSPHDDRLVELEMELRLEGVPGSSASSSAAG